MRTFIALSLLASVMLPAAALAQSAPVPTSNGTQSTTAAGFPYGGSTPGSYRPDYNRNYNYQRLGPNLTPFPQSVFYENQYQQVPKYCRCAARIGEDRPRRALAASANSRTELVELSLLTSSARACLPYGYRAPVVFLRGGLAEALYAEVPLAQRAERRGPVDQRQLSAFLATEAASGAARLPDDRAYTRLATCLTVSAPAPVDGVLASCHGSRAERRAPDAVFAASPGCSSADRSPRYGALTFMRAYLAESAWRWATFQPVGRASLS